MSNTVDMAKSASKYVAVASALQRKLAAVLSPLQKEANAAKSLLPSVIEKLVAADVLPGEHKEAAARQLLSHSGALTVLVKAAEYIQELQSVKRSASELGEGITEKRSTPFLDLTKTPYVGDPTNRKRESDRVFDEILGL